MKIIKLNAENIKKLVAVEIKPSGDIVTIAGKNGAGKTSVLDSIWWAPGARRASAQAQRRRYAAQPRLRCHWWFARIRLSAVRCLKTHRTGRTLPAQLSGVRTVSETDKPDEPDRLRAAQAAYTGQTTRSATQGAGQTLFDAIWERAGYLPMAKPGFIRERAVYAPKDNDCAGIGQGMRSVRAFNRDAKAKRAQAEGIAVPVGEPAPLVDESALIEDGMVKVPA